MSEVTANQLFKCLDLRTKMLAQLSSRLGIDHAEGFPSAERALPHTEGLKQGKAAMPSMHHHPVASVARVLRHSPAARRVSDGVHAFGRGRSALNRDTGRSDEVAHFVQVALWICLQILVKQQEH